jgi:hypothetical protein
VVKGVGYSDTRGKGDKHGAAPVMGAGGAEVKGPLAVLRPLRSLFSGIVDDNELAWGVNWAGGNIEGGTVDAVPGRDSGI